MQAQWLSSLLLFHSGPSSFGDMVLLNGDVRATQLVGDGRLNIWTWTHNFSLFLNFSQNGENIWLFSSVIENKNCTHSLWNWFHNMQLSFASNSTILAVTSRLTEGLEAKWIDFGQSGFNVPGYNVPMDRTFVSSYFTDHYPACILFAQKSGALSYSIQTQHCWGSYSTEYNHCTSWVVLIQIP